MPATLRSGLVLFALVASALRLCESFSPSCRSNSKRQVNVWQLSATQHDVSRRSFGYEITSVLGVTSAFVAASPAFAAKAAQASEQDIAKEKILKGYQRLNYLLDNWVQETTICGRDDNPYLTGKGCERTPFKVMEYLGYKNINDPLFKADKTMKKLEPLIPKDRFGEYLDAIELWSEAAEEGNGMAFISSWGEANPGGGKDRIELFIERAKKNVIDSRDSLKVIVDILGLE